MIDGNASIRSIAPISTEQNPGEDVAAEFVGAEQVCAARPGAAEREVLREWVVAADQGREHAADHDRENDDRSGRGTGRSAEPAQGVARVAAGQNRYGSGNSFGHARDVAPGARPALGTLGGTRRYTRLAKGF
jgi:hypothetical protein